MPNTERLMKQGLLAELRGHLARLENQAENHLSALRVATFVEKSPLDLDTGNIAAAQGDLCAAIRQAADLRRRITELEDELGD